jgi:acetolactate synthase I/II/III large subunit
MWEEVERATLTVFPDGQAARANQVPIAHLGPAADFQHMMAIFGGYGERVDKPEDLPAALGRALHAVKEGRQALLNIIVGRRGVQP